ncbi:hypothetical protein P6F26_02340 [Roseibacterium sp. SDUM158017]|uniref:hypothetical protein n=1 Tax=Roseicyclus salinarum TaxID=3036773 RepID=UPI0024154259|nr:hypothetical protein [Roseibacterium sp. SDUM158017]MDG4647271.1 hypothetical protein [Roseibacterium sp. SDUM158017]
MSELNIAKANSTAFKTFSNTHEELGNALKVVSVGLSLTTKEIQAGTSSAALWSQVGLLAEQWGTKPMFSDTIIETAYSEVANLGLARSFSAFDRFLTDVEAELSSLEYHNLLSPSQVSTQVGSAVGTVDETGLNFERFYLRHGFDTSREDFVVPVFDYYRSARNCIIHRSGVASSELESMANSTRLADALQSWVKRTHEHGPLKLKTFKEGDVIKFDYFDAILCFSVLRRLALDIDRQTVPRAGITGLTFLAAKHCMKRWKSGTDEIEHSTAPKAIASYLSRVNRVVGCGWRIVEPQLNRLGILEDCNQAFFGRHTSDPGLE